MKSGLKSLIILILFSLFLSPSILNAQIPTTIDPVSISSYPQVAAPNQKVNISLESYSTDLNAASIVWLLDNKNYSRGIGLKSIEITAPSLGKTMVITAVIKTVEGREIRETISITPGSVDLVWESEGYTPPLFEGKSIFAYQNILRVIAVPHLAGSNATEMDPKTLLYKWTLNGRVVQDQSGYGRQTLVVQEELPRDLEIIVEVTTPNGSHKALNRLALSPGDPSISFYEEDPLYGVLYNRSLARSVNLSSQEISIRAIPYFFTFSRDIPLSFNWSINNLGRNDLSTNESITLRTKGDVEGSSVVSLDIRSTSNILQGARNSINVLFSKRKSQTENNVTF